MASVSFGQNFFPRDFCEHLLPDIICDSTSRWLPKHEPELFTCERLSRGADASCLSALHHIPGAKHRAENVGPRLRELLFQNLNMSRLIPCHLPYISLWGFLRCFKSAWLCLLRLYPALIWVKGRLTTKLTLLAFPTISIIVISHQSAARCVFSLFPALFCKLLLSSTVSCLRFTCFMTCYCYCFSNMLSLCSYFELIAKWLFIFFCQKAE